MLSPKEKLPVDKDVKIPPAVLRASQAADALHKQVYETPDEIPNEGNQPPSPPVEQPPAPPSPPVAQPPAPPPPLEISQDEWKHRYESIKGRYEILTREQRSTNDRISQLEALLAAKEPAQPTTPAPISTAGLVTPDEEREYGPELVDLIGRKARMVADSTFMPIINELREKIGKLGGDVSIVRKSVDSSRFDALHEYLTKEIPNWQDINKDRKFLDWLALPDAYSGAIRQDMLNNAFQAVDAARVANFFKGFINDEAVTAPATAVVPAPAVPPVVPPAPAIDLKTLAAPGRAKAAARETPAEKPIISPAQISAFYADSAAGRYKGREVEQQANELAIFDAQREGRIK